jgi:hypothetical protein
MPIQCCDDHRSTDRRLDPPSCPDLSSLGTELQRVIAACAIDSPVP